MTNYADRIRGWAKAHPTKTATVEDVLALRANVVANMEQAGKTMDDRLKRAEAAITTLNTEVRALDVDMTHNVETMDSDLDGLEEIFTRLHARLETLERRTVRARVRRVWAGVVAVTWRLRLALHREPKDIRDIPAEGGQ
jgi:hypothetical protein